MKKIIFLICSVLISSSALADDIIVNDTGNSYLILSQEPKQVKLTNGQKVNASDYTVPNIVHLTPESNAIYDITWSGFSSPSSDAGTIDGVHSYTKDGYRYSSDQNTRISCKFKAKGSVTFNVSTTVPRNSVYRSYIDMSYDSNPITSYHDYSSGLSSYTHINDTYTANPGDDEEHTLSFYIHLDHYKDKISISVSIQKNETIEEGDYTVTQIGQEAFKDCSALQTITLQEGVVAIGADAFKNCINLNTINCYNTTPPVANEVTFNGIDKTSIKIAVPASSIELYKNAEGWNTFAATCFVPLTLAPESITLNYNTISIVEGQKEELTATILPLAAMDKTISWTSSNENIATVDDGVVTAKAQGETIITATTSNGITTTCLVTVTEDIEATTKGFKESYATILAKTVDNVTADDLMGIEAALDFYKLLSDEAKEALSTEKALLDALMSKAEEIKNRCSKPVIKIVRRQLVINCDTEGAQIHYTVSPIIEEYFGNYENPLDIPMCFKITAYATMEGRMESETVTETLALSDIAGLIGDVNLDGRVSISDVNSLIDILLENQE